MGVIDRVPARCPRRGLRILVRGLIHRGGRVRVGERRRISDGYSVECEGLRYDGGRRERFRIGARRSSRGAGRVSHSALVARRHIEDGGDPEPREDPRLVAIVQRGRALVVDIRLDACARTGVRIGEAIVENGLGVMQAALVDGLASYPRGVHLV